MKKQVDLTDLAGKMSKEMCKGSGTIKMIRLAICVISVFATVPFVSGDAIIYQERFQKSGQLIGTMTDIGEGVWENIDNRTSWKGDGSVEIPGGDDSAWLPFVPRQGEVYELSASIRYDGGRKFICLGFNLENASGAYGRSAASFFLEKNGVLSAVAGVGGHKGVLKFIVGTEEMIEVKVVLDCRDVDENRWTVTHYLGGHVLEGTENRPRQGGMARFSDIRYVGFFRSNGTVGTIQNFQLSIVGDGGSSPVAYQVVAGAETVEAANESHVVSADTSVVARQERNISAKPESAPLKRPTEPSSENSYARPEREAMAEGSSVEEANGDSISLGLLMY